MTGSREKESFIARMELLCANLPWSTLSASIVAVAFVITLGQHLSMTVLVCWLVLVQLVLLVRWWLVHRWHTVPTTQDNANRRLIAATILTTSTALLFGAIGFLGISSEEPVIIVLVVMLISGMAAGVTAAFSSILTMYLLYLLPLMLPVAYRLFLFNDFSYQIMAGLILLYIPVSVAISRNVNASIQRSIDLRFENLQLLEQLREEKHRVQEALSSEEKASRAKSTFLSAASHDLRQPLHSLRLFTTALDIQSQDSEQKRLVSQINASVLSLEEMFNVLLDISKLDAGTIEPQTRNVYLDNLLAQLEDEFAPAAHAKGLKFTLDKNGHTLFTDGVLFAKLVQNLLSNAIKYTDSGQVTIRSSAAQGSDHVLLEILDSGVGIPDEETARVFEEFVQLDNDARDRSLGMGLGLSVVKRLCKLLGVEIDFISKAGSGTQVSLKVPAGTRQVPVDTQTVTHDQSDAASAHMDSLFVLVIDDDEPACLAMEALLEHWGCVVMIAHSGDAALHQLDEIGEEPDILITDYRLRNGETGGDVVRRIRNTLRRQLPAIILTGDIAAERLVEIRGLGLPLLHKPCEPHALRALIAQETLESIPSVEYG
ncbi:MAG: hybrid sensor histidine kinase/response regulator [Granulosicoccus sp.]